MNTSLEFLNKTNHKILAYFILSKSRECRVLYQILSTRCTQDKKQQQNFQSD